MKMKTNKGAAKRMRKTASGKIKRKGAFGRHIMRSKNAKRKRHMKQTMYVHDANIYNAERLLPNG
ncbi:MAG: 50S ribosomal protein L35 [Oligoflexia bacterium]|nr:50S ribosomal protein L35 [Oligoflexia bacterium]